MSFGLKHQLMRPCCVIAYDDGGGAQVQVDSGGVFSSGGGGSSSSSSAGISPVTSSSGGLGFDLSQSSVQAAVARGNTAADILSAHQTYLTGIPTGRGGTYALDAQKRFGYSSIRDAAAAYLDAAGLRRLAETLSLKKAVIDPEPVPDESGVKRTDEPMGKGDPFATLGDLVKVFERVFSAPSSDTQAPVVVVGDATQGEQKAGGSSLGIVLVVLALGAGAVYWFYLRKKGASSAN